MAIDDSQPTVSSADQHKVERDAALLYRSLFKYILKTPDSSAIDLHRQSHANFLLRALGSLPGGYASGLDASRPWVTFWASQGLCLLGLDEELHGVATGLQSFISSCQSPTGGFGGGPYQLPHLAPTYAAVATLVNIGTPSALDIVDRQNMRAFLQQMCVPEEGGGGIAVHEEGEVDIRSCYLALATAYMLHLDLNDLADRSSLVRYIQRCQTYEGGLGGEPGNEAHGGYTYCGLAAIVLMCRAEGASGPAQASARPSPAAVLDLSRLEAWAAARQAAVEGGFNGRTGKLTDGCYSFWQGALFPLIQEARTHAAQAVRHAEAAPQLASAAQSGDGNAPLVPELPDCLKIGTGVCGVVDLQQPTAEWQPWSQEAEESVDPHQHSEHVACSASAAIMPGAPAAAALAELMSEYTPPALPPQKADLQAALANAQQEHEGSLPVADAGQTEEASKQQQPLVFNAVGLQMWLLLACQQPSGLRDKPGKSPDFYHTCYCLSGLAVAQQCSGRVLGQPSNAVRRTDVCVNVMPDKMAHSRKRFAEMTS
eukprot:jgi/Ulvmu1/1919/UM012_0079.1